jgi:hypothetical protein
MSESHTRVDSRDESVPLGTSTKPRQAMAVPQMLSSREAELTDSARCAGLTLV